MKLPLVLKIYLIWVLSGLFAFGLEEGNQIDANWGRSQVEMLLKDRPQLQSIVVKDNKIWDWLTRAFDNKSQGIRIHWDPSSLQSPGLYEAECHWPDDNKDVYIRIRKPQSTNDDPQGKGSPEDMLVSVVFELNNAKYRDENLRLRALAKGGGINRDDYSRLVAKNEYLAAQDTGVFYRNIWIPYCVDTHFSPNPKFWYVARDVDFARWLADYPAGSYYPWQIYGQQYDSIVKEEWSKESAAAASLSVKKSHRQEAIELDADGCKRLRENHPEAAIEAFTEAIKLDSTLADAYNNRAVAEKNLGRLDDSIHDCDAAIALDPSISAAYFNRGSAKFSKNDFTGARDDASQAIGKDPDNAGAYNLRADSYMRMDNNEAALEDYNKAVAIDPKLTEAYYNRGLMRSKQGDFSTAIDDFSKAIQLNPKLSQPIVMKGRCRQALGDLTGALDDFNQAIVITPQEASIYSRRGCLFFEQKNFSAALADFQKSIQLEPASVDNHFFVWLIKAMSQEQRASADTDLKNFLHSLSSTKEQSLSIGWFLIGELTIEDILKTDVPVDAKKNKENYAEVFFYIGMKLELTGDKEKGLLFLQKSVEAGDKSRVEYQIAQFWLKNELHTPTVAPEVKQK